MPDIDLAEVQQKLDRGETLTEDETKAVMSEPNANESNIGVMPQEEEIEDITDKTSKSEKKEEKEDDKKEDEKSEEEKAAEKAEKKKKEKEEAEASKDKKDDKLSDEEEAKSIAKVNTELEKPAGQEDLKDFTPREKGYFYEMRRLRTRAQNAEGERDGLKFKEIKRKAQEEASKKEAKEKEDEDIFKGREDDEYLSIADAKKLVDKVKGKPKENVAETDAQAGVKVMQKNYLAMCDKEAREQFSDDYDEVIEAGRTIIENNEEYKKQVAAAIVQGQNPGVIAYNLCKADPKFKDELPKAEARLKAKGFTREKKEEGKKESEKKEDPAKAAEKKIEENQKKVKTSGHYSTGSDSAEDMTAEQFYAMSDQEFQAIPKQKRDALLKRFG